MDNDNRMYRFVCCNGFCTHIEDVPNYIDVNVSKYKQCPKCLDLMEIILMDELDE